MSPNQWPRYEVSLVKPVKSLLSVHRDVHIHTVLLLSVLPIDTSLYRTLHHVCKVFALEGFHCSTSIELQRSYSVGCFSTVQARPIGKYRGITLNPSSKELTVPHGPSLSSVSRARVRLPSDGASPEDLNMMSPSSQVGMCV